MSMDEVGTPKVDRRLAAILAGDIGGYDALIGIDEEATFRDLKAHQVMVMPIVGEYGGAIIYTAGDGSAEFEDRSQQSLRGGK